MIRQSRSRPVSRSETLPAPVGGWNARDSLAAMPITDAAVLENFYPNATSVTLRAGETSWASGFTDPVQTLMPFTGSASAKLFACSDTGIFDITSSGAIGAAVTATTEGYCSFTNISTAGGNYLFVVNGVDSLRRYDGTTWITVTGTGTGAITGITTADMNYVTAFKRRLWFVEKSSMRLWYLAAGAVAGAATSFDAGPLFKRGGNIIAATSWTIDGGEGIDDYFVIVSSQGELAVYKGTDPSSSDTWALVGLYYIGAPMNNRCFVAYGGDLLFLCRIGLYPLSKVLTNNPTLEGLSLAGKIQTAFNQATTLYSSYEGWMMCAYPKTGALLVNVPIVAEQRWDQYVQNMLTGAWTKFTGWNGYCLATYNEELYLGKGDTVTKIWSGESDLNGTNIQGTALQAFTQLRSSMQNKAVKLMKPYCKVNGSFYIGIGVNTDYRLNDTFNLKYIAFAEGGVWDEDYWDVDFVWAFDEYNYADWFTPQMATGQTIGVKLRLESNISTLSWNATELVFETGGTL